MFMTRGAQDDRSLGQVVSDLSTELSTLMKQEVELAKAELKQEVAKVGKGAGLLAAPARRLVRAALPQPRADVPARQLAADRGSRADHDRGVGGRRRRPGRDRPQGAAQANPQLPQTQQTLKEDVQWARAQKS